MQILPAPRPMSSLQRSHAIRQSLHLSIDPYPYDSRQVLIAPDSSSPSSSSVNATIDSSEFSPTSGPPLEGTIYSVLCMYDFQSDDTGHLSFNKNEILDVIKEEDTGWWAAMRRGGDAIGWIPEAFVRPLTEEMTDRLLHVREELRVYEYDAELLYQRAPISRNEQLYDTSPQGSPSRTLGWDGTTQGSSVSVSISHTLFIFLNLITGPFNVAQHFIILHTRHICICTLRIVFQSI